MGTQLSGDGVRLRHGPPRHDIADLSGASVPSEGYDWSLIIDHDNVHKNLVGWVHTRDID
ncbi:hypothetical protein [Lentzea sp. NEAU-D7]|uniref:hypothetical protein n=1 Tax=Lentzea sp. NEAU-D7 TaxID=2994667 RepID=UPI00224A9836|nr:hypothetical protein [Lentzea sp. NEAU-D7]MCX2949420.1 hypothetical protein [Lentzea sp. NEAU-D7]